MVYAFTLCAMPSALCASQPFCEAREPQPGLIIPDRYGKGLFRSHQDDELSRPGDSRVNEIPLKQEEVLRGDDEHHGRIFAPLALWTETA